MSSLRLVTRQIRANSSVAGLLALVVAVGCALGAAAPTWIKASLEDALRDTITQADGNLTFVSRGALESLASVEDFLDAPVQHEPLLADIYDNGRWLVSTDMASMNGNPFNQVSLHTAGAIFDHITITDGEVPSTEPTWDIPPPWEEPFSDGRLPVLTVETVISDRVAEDFKLSVGDTITTTYGAIALEDNTNAIIQLDMRLSGTFEPVDPDWPGWVENHDALRTYTIGDTIFGSVLAAPEVLDHLGQTFVPSRSEWILPPAPSESLTDVSAITESIRRLESNYPGWSTALDLELERYSTQLVSATSVNALGGASLVALFAIVILLSVRQLAGRHTGAQQLMRARGGQARRLIRQLLLEAFIIAGPAGLAGVLIGAWLVKDPLIPLGFAIAAGLVVLVCLGFPVITLLLARRHNLDRPERASLRPSPRMIFAETGFVVIAGVVLWLLSGRSADGSSVDPVASLAPVIAAIAAGLVIFRTLPFFVAGVTRWARAGRGATAFLSAARTSRASGSATMPVIAILIAVGLAAMGASVDASAERARQAASWNTVPADLIVANAGSELSADEVREQLPGVTEVAVGYELNPDQLEGPGGRPADAAVLAVDVASWQRIVDRAPTQIPAVEALTQSPGGGPPAALAGSTNAIFADADVTIDGVTATVVEELQVFPGVPRSPSIVVPVSAVADQIKGITPTVYYLGGDVSAEQAAEILGGTVYSRADALAEITAAPLLQTTDDIYRLAMVGSAGLAAAAAVLSLLIAGRSRARSLSILHTLGFTHRQATSMVIAEALPAVTVAAALGVAIGSGVTLLAADALDLTALTTTLGGEQELVLNVFGTAWTAIGVLAAVLLAVAATVIADRRAQLGSALRAGDE